MTRNQNILRRTLPALGLLVLFTALFAAVSWQDTANASANAATGPSPTPTPGIISVTVGTVPNNLSFIVDGATYTNTQLFEWIAGSTHTISVLSPQLADQTRYVWNSWSDGGAQSHTVTAGTTEAYTANFTTQYLLTMCCYSELGSVSPPTGFVDAGQVVQISAVGNNWPFDRWSGTGTGSYSGPDNPATVVMNGPIREKAEFVIPTPTPQPPWVTPTPSPRPTPIQTLWVNTVADTSDDVPGDSHCLDHEGMCSLRAAITEANTFTGSTTIFLPAGIYTQGVSGTPEDVNLSGDWDITSAIVLIGEGSANTIIQAGAAADTATERVIHVLNGGAVDLRGLTIRNGRHLFVLPDDPGGGGIGVDATSSLKLDGVVVENNISEGSGGGIHVGTRGADLTISNSVIRNNRAGSSAAGSTAAGGGINIDSAGESAFPATNRFTDVSVTGNVVNTSVANAFGGGVSATAKSSEFWCTRCVISDNESISTAEGLEGTAGGFYTKNTYVQCEYCDFVGNAASHLAGGVRIFHPTDGSGSLTLSRSTVSDNSAPSVGGIMSTGGALNIGRSTISGNVASDSKGGIAGGIYNSKRTTHLIGWVSLTDSTVSGNHAPRGGGVYNEGPINRIRSSYSTIVANTATISGGGLWQDVATTGTSYLKSSIVAGNVAPVGPDLYGTFTSENYNHIENIAGSTIGLMPNDVTGLDPDLGEFGFHGGHTKTYVPQPGSPTLNQIPLFTNQCNNNLNTDQREFPRLSGERCDKGSVEVGPGDHRQSTPFDYDGDGRMDFSVFRPSGGLWYLQRSAAGFQGVQFGLGTDRLAPADYDGDGRTDIAVYRPSAGTWFILKSATGTVDSSVFGLAQDLPAPGDYDGDGKADLTVFRPSQGRWYRQSSSNGSVFVMQFGVNGDVPTVGDFDGDGTNDLGIFKPSLGDWYHIRSSNGSVFGERMGQTGDKIAPADYDGDGKTDIAIFRPSTGLWVVRNSATATYSYHVFGAPADIPISGDYDGDGKADIGVWRPSDGTWYIQRSINGQFIVFPWGQNGDRPTPSAFGN